MKITFLGAAGEVTGSCFLVEAAGRRFLVDCGMFQGGAGADRKNRRFGFPPREIDFVLLSHAHIDHSGLLPRLAAQGLTGPGYATEATRGSSRRPKSLTWRLRSKPGTYSVTRKCTLPSCPAS